MTGICAFASFSVSAQDLQYDLEKQRKRETFEQLIFDTRDCMRNAAQAILMQGARDSEQILPFEVAVCGTALRNFMVSQLQIRDEDAAIFTRAMAERELYAIPGVKAITKDRRPGSR